MDKDDQEKLEKEANELDKSMMFIFGCKNNKMLDNLKQMSIYNDESTHKQSKLHATYTEINMKRDQEITTKKEMTIVRRRRMRTTVWQEIRTHQCTLNNGEQGQW